jgi:hypothetical protein
VLIHGNGFIAAFVAGLAFGALARDTAHAAARFSEETGTLLSLTVWFVFGAAVGPVLLHEGLQWRPIVYALLSLTVIRMVPVTLALLGKKVHWSTTLFIGWFGPRCMECLRARWPPGTDAGPNHSRPGALNSNPSRRFTRAGAWQRRRPTGRPDMPP